MEKKEKQLSHLVIDPELKRDLKTYTSKKNTSMKEVVETLIKQKLEEDGDLIESEGTG